MPDADGHPAPEEMDLPQVLHALADPLRYQVIAALAADPDDAERTCSSFALPVHKTTLTHHFKVLREAGLVRQVNRGNSRMAALRREDLNARFPGLLDLIAASPPATSAPNA